MNTKYMLLCAAMLISSSSAMATRDDTPIIEFKTTLYEQAAEQNSFQFTLGTIVKDYYDIDCGFGLEEYEIEPAVFDSESQSIQGTVVTASVSKDGCVRIYGDPENIDYIEIDGCYLTDISFPQTTNVEVLNLENNNLTGLDLSHMHKLQALYLDGNPFSAESPLIIGTDKPDLTILSLNIIEHMDPSFTLRDYPSLVSFSAWNNKSLSVCDPTACPDLMQLSIDVTSVESLDVSKNPKLIILNISETRIPSIDISQNPYLTEFYATHTGRANNDVKLTELNIGSKPQLTYLFASDNKLRDLDISGCPNLVTLNCAGNLLTTIDISDNSMLYDVDLSRNYMDFVTLPSPRETFGAYYYSQKPFTVDRSYPVGGTIDFSAKVNRPESTTTATVYMVSESDLLNPTVLDETYYTYADGILTLKCETPDSVYVSFSNTELADYPMTTSKFIVKSADKYGLPIPAATLGLSSLVSNYSFSVGISGASEENPVTFSVDFGDGQLVDFTATTSGLPETDNVSGKRAGSAIIYIPEGYDLTALGANNVRMNSVTLSTARSLSQLSLTNCNLPRIDLTWNRALTSLDLSGNTLTTIDLSTDNGGYGKNVLSSINLSGNRLTDVTFNDHRTLIDLDLSDNQLTTVPMKDMTNLVTLNVSGNNLEELSLQDCEALSTLDASDNLLTTFYIPDYTPLTSLNISGNNISLPELPVPGCVADYIYAPQKEISIPSKAPSINLSSEWLEIDGMTTTYTWHKVSDGTELTESQVSGDKGRYTFLDTTVGNVYCLISHPAFPDFSGDNFIRTTNVEAATMPTNLFASFTTLESDTVSIVLTAAKKGTAVYIDWKDNGDLEQYVLATSYIPFTAISTAGANVKCYSYEEDEGLTVFSLSGVRTTDMDASRMKGLIAFTASGTGMTEDEIILPQSPGLTELNLSGNSISSYKWYDYPELYLLNLSSNNIETLDLSEMKKLQVFHAAFNGIKSVKFDNPVMWEANLMDNALESISFEGAPSISQLWLSNNNLSDIDVSGLNDLKVFFIDGNKFTFATLPPVLSSYLIYNFLNQQIMDVALVDGKIDLSAQAVVDGTETAYHWFIDSPYLDDYDELAGEELVAGEEYTLVDGVTTFHGNFTNIMCVMTNEKFPSLYLMTNFINVTGSGLEEIEISGSEPVEYFNLQGIKVENPTSGIYIRRQGSKTDKILVK